MPYMDCRYEKELVITFNFLHLRMFWFTYDAEEGCSRMTKCMKYVYSYTPAVPEIQLTSAKNVVYFWTRLNTVQLPVIQVALTKTNNEGALLTK